MKNSEEARKIIGEKLKDARLENDEPMTEDDIECYRILACDRENHEKSKKRSMALKRSLKSIAVIAIVLTVTFTGMFIGMSIYSKVNATPSELYFLNQQGSNIVISGSDDNISFTKDTYRDIEQIPEEYKEEINIIKMAELEFVKMTVKSEDNISRTDIYYKMLPEETYAKAVLNIDNITDITVIIKVLEEQNKKVKYNEKDIYFKKKDDLISCSIIENDSIITLTLPEAYFEKNKEAILNDLTD